MKPIRLACDEPETMSSVMVDDYREQLSVGNLLR